MPSLRLAPAALLVFLSAAGLAACSSGPSSSGASGTASTKAAFCGADVALDMGGSSATSAAGFLAFLKAHKAELDAMDNNAPAGKVGEQARALVSAAEAAIASNNPNGLTSSSLSSDGAAADTYCGVDGSGNPLPAYFGAGKGSPFCSVSGMINAGTSAATDAAGVLAFLAAHQSLITQYATYVPNLPSSIQSQAQTLVNTAQAAIASNNSSALGTQAISQDSMDVQLYCGQNS